MADKHHGSLPMIKDMLGALFPRHEGLQARLSDRALWLLFQRRHLIAHRRGEIDRSYLDLTADSFKVADRLVVTSGYVYTSVGLARDLAFDLLAAMQSE
jgi:hypothetical protein